MGTIVDLTPISILSRTYSGTLVKNIGFEWMMFGVGILCFCYAPLLLLLKSPPTKEEKKVSPEGIDNLGAEVDDDISTKALALRTDDLNTKL